MKDMQSQSDAISHEISTEPKRHRISEETLSRALPPSAVTDADRAALCASIADRVTRWFQLEDSLVLIGNSLAPYFLLEGRTVFDATVAELYPHLVHAPLECIPSGEQYKTPETIMRLWHDFARAGLGRGDTVVACGGGVTGDLTGFAAATWMRGIPWLNIPTTLLAMVDASTGGKTGCDLPEGKNLAGAFHPPRLVAIDVDFLNTLPPRMVRSGYGELIKHFIIGKQPGTPAPAPVMDFKSLPTAEQIADSLEVKINIVRQDPLETRGLRLLLNCGHTIGHAVESASGYTLSHGEAVAIGCVQEARLAVEKGLAPASWPQELGECFLKAGLPVELPDGMTRESLIERIRMDKKKNAGAVTYALPCGWGDVKTIEIPL